MRRWATRSAGQHVAGHGGFHEAGGGRLTSAERAQALLRVRRLADLLDSRYRVPGTNIRFGLDAIIGVIPGVGDTITALMGGSIVLEAARLGARRRTIARMLLNLGIDWLVGLVPVLDLILDVAYKANNRNARLLLEELAGSSDAGDATQRAAP